MACWRHRVRDTHRDAQFPIELGVRACAVPLRMCGPPLRHANRYPTLRSAPLPFESEVERELGKVRDEEQGEEDETKGGGGIKAVLADVRDIARDPLEGKVGRSDELHRE